MYIKAEKLIEDVFDKMAVMGAIGYTIAIISMVISMLASVIVNIYNPVFYVLMLRVVVISLAAFTVGVIGLSVMGRIKFYFGM